jgi:acyl transferase domain-containing protein
MTDVTARIGALPDARRELLERLRQRQGDGPGDGTREGGEPIAIIGMACRFPGGASEPEAFWRLLRDGVDATTEVPAGRWDLPGPYDPDLRAADGLYVRRGGFLTEPVDRFDAAFFGISPREAEAMDPQQRLLLEVTWEALENAGQAPGRLAGTEAGVFVGIGIDDYKSLQTRHPAGIDAYTGTGNLFCVAAGRLSYVLGLRGPSMAVDTGCSSSLVAVHLACQSLRSAESEMAVAGGVHLMLTPDMTLSLCRAGALSADGRCKTFDASADGYARGEGCGVVVLKRLRDAVACRDAIVAVIRGSAVNHGGPSGGLTVPSGQAQERLLRRALANAGVCPAEVSYVETHGTGTPLGDPIEVQALADVYGGGRPAGDPLPLGAVKTNIGHLEAAAGAAGLLKAVLCLGRQEIPANLHLREPSPRIAWDGLGVFPVTGRLPWKRAERPRIAGISSFGIGGTNAHLIVEEPPVPAAPEPASGDPDARLITLSARTGAALAALTGQYAGHLRAHPEIALADVAHTANAGRADFAHRAGVVAGSTEQAAARLAELAAGRPLHEMSFTGRAGGGRGPRIAFAFTGQGSQRPDMGRRLYDTEPVYRRAVDDCCELIAGQLERPLTSVIFTGGDDRDRSALDDTAYTQPALFAVEYALTRLWASWGITPSVVVGHSVGEYAAACAAGVLPWQDALRLVAHRGRLMKELGLDGTMAVVAAGADQVRDTLAKRHQDVCVAAVNGPRETVISGTRAGVEAAGTALAAGGVRVRPLPVSRAFHSSLIDPMLEEFGRIAAAHAYGSARLTMISTVTGEQATGDDLACAAYWRRNTREPVRFLDAARTLLARGCDAVVEIGPDPVLGGMMRRSGLDGAASLPWLASLRRGRDDRTQALSGLAALYAAGATIDGAGLDSGRRPATVSLPTYPFERERYWRAPAPATVPPVMVPPATVPPEDDFPGRRLRSPALRGTATEIRFGHDTPSFAADHRLLGEIVVPGASYLAMLAAAANGESGPCVAEDISFTQALVPGAGPGRLAQLIIDEPASGGRGFRVVSAGENGDGAWTPHLSGVLRDGALRDGALPGAGPRAGGPPGHAQTLPGADLRAAMRKAGYDLGPTFQWITELARAGREARVVLARPAAASYPLHPGLIDSLFQAMFAVTPDGSGDDPDAIRVPVHVGRFTYHGRPAGDVLSARVTVREAGPGEHDMTGDAVAWDARGRAVVEMTGVVLRGVPRTALLRDRHAGVAGLLHRLGWHAVPGRHAGLGPGRWLVFADTDGVAGHLEVVLRDAGGSVTLVLPGEAYRRPDAGRATVDPGNQAHMTRLVEEAGPFTGVAFLWGLGDGGADPVAASERVTGAALHLLRALADRDCRLLLVTRGAQAVGDGDPVSPAHASLWGLGRVARAEYPALRCVLADLEAGEPAPARDAAAIAAELAGHGHGRESDDGQVGYRHGVRYLAALTPVSAAGGLVAHAEATYLITGGLGALGRHVARLLVARGARWLVLTGRGEPDERAQPAVTELERLGATVVLARADVSRRDELALVLDRIRSTMPPLRGVVHAAGVADDGVLAMQSRERARRVAAPKVAGSWHLHTLTREDPLDFFVLFSSAAALVGTAGQGTYAAANAFLDGLAAGGQHRVGPVGWRGDGLGPR